MDKAGSDRSEPVILRPSRATVTKLLLLSGGSVLGALAGLARPTVRTFGLPGLIIGVIGLGSGTFFAILAVRTLADRRRGSVVITDRFVRFRPHLLAWQPPDEVPKTRVVDAEVSSHYVRMLWTGRTELRIVLVLDDGREMTWWAARGALDEPGRSMTAAELRTALLV